MDFHKFNIQLIFSDFNYGCLTQTLIGKMIHKAKIAQIIIGADSQSSSQIGDISRFKNATLITPTEYEARISLKDNKSGLQHIGNQLVQNLETEATFITLGSAGVLVVSKNEDPDSDLLTDLLPALNPHPIDTSGAGDSLLTIGTLALACNATPYQAALLGSLGAAIQISRIGNVPIENRDLRDSILNY